MLGGKSENICSSKEVVFLGFLVWTELSLTRIDFDDSTDFLLTGLLMLVVLEVRVPDSEASSVV